MKQQELARHDTYDEKQVGNTIRKVIIGAVKVQNACRYWVNRCQYEAVKSLQHRGLGFSQNTHILEPATPINQNRFICHLNLCNL
jgi:hypothetical protein